MLHMILYMALNHMIVMIFTARVTECVRTCLGLGLYSHPKEPGMAAPTGEIKFLIERLGSLPNLLANDDTVSLT